MGNSQAGAYYAAGAGASTAIDPFHEKAREILAAMGEDITNIDLRNRGLQQIPDEVFSFQRVTSLNLNSNRLTQVPPSIGMANSLTVLRLSQNSITELPAELSLLTSLVLRDISKNSLTSFPTDLFSGMVNLKEIMIHSNKLRDLPESLRKCKSLCRLQVYNNRLEGVTGIDELPALVEFDAAHNYLQWPSNLCACIQITAVNLAGNHITEIPPEVGNMTALHRLDLRMNSLETLPESFGDCLSLAEIFLRTNSLTSLPESIGHLSTLTSLRLEKNSLTSVPKNITRLHTLCRLDLSHNMLTRLSTEITQLSRLTELDLSSNRLTKCSKRLGNLTALKFLYLHENQLTSLPDTIGNLTSLHTATLSRNQLLSLPHSFSLLSSLCTLDLASNQLKSLPPDISMFQSLQSLNISNNQLTSVPPSLPSLERLRFLYLAFNSISTFPTFDFFMGLSSLQSLHLGYNPVADLAGSLLFPPSLTSLHLDGLELSYLPPVVFRLPQLKNLSFSNNPEIAGLDGPFSLLNQLQSLDCCGCNIQFISPSLAGASKLTYLNLSNNGISQLPSSLGKLQCLVDLDVSANRLTSLPQSIISCSSLKKLKCGFNLLAAWPQECWWSQPVSSSDPERSHSDQPEPSTSSDADSTDVPEELWISFEGNPCFNLEEKPHRRLTRPSVVRKPITPDIELCSYLPLADLPSFLVAPHANADNLVPIHTFPDGLFIPLDIKSISPSNPIPIPIPNIHLGMPWKIQFGWAEMVGRRPDQEDTFVIIKDLLGCTARHLIGLYDGHGGAKCAELCATLFPTLFLDALKAYKSKDHRAGLSAACILRALADSYIRLQKYAAYLQVEAGCTAMSILFSYGSIFIAYVGDCRAVIYRRDGSCLPLSWDHKPFDASEYLRIRRLGGYVTEDQRVNGVLATSRSIGDVSLQPFITYQPQLISYTTQFEDWFVVVACDGLWDVLTNAEVFEIAQQCGTSSEAALRLRDAAYAIGSTDNITVIVAHLPAEQPVWFDHARRPPPPRRMHLEDCIDDTEKPEKSPPLADTYAPKYRSLHSRLKSPFRRKDKSKQAAPAPSPLALPSISMINSDLDLDQLYEQVHQQFLLRVGDRTRFESVMLRSSSNRQDHQEALNLAQFAAHAIRTFIDHHSGTQRIQSWLEIVDPPAGVVQGDQLSYLLFSRPDDLAAIQHAVSQYLQLMTKLMSIHQTVTQDKKFASLLKKKGRSNKESLSPRKS